MPDIYGRLRILVADDDWVIASTLAQILCLAGHDAETVSSGEEAIAAATRNKPDVLISDVVMSGITGIEAAINILEFVPECLVILFSGQANTANQLDSAHRLGYEFEILTKPVHPKVLLDLVADFALERTARDIHRGVRADACC